MLDPSQGNVLQHMSMAYRCHRKKKKKKKGVWPIVAIDQNAFRCICFQEWLPEVKLGVSLKIK